MNAGPAFLLDDRGEVHLELRLPGMLPDDHFEDRHVAVRERGYVEWQVRAGHVFVRLRPSLVSPAAFARLMSWLLGHRPERVFLSCFVKGEWTYEYLRKPKEAARRVQWLVELHGGGDNCNVRRQRISISSSRNPPQWERAVDLWRQFHACDPNLISHLFDGLFAGRWILYARGSDNTFAIDDFGPNQSAHVMRWLTARRDISVADAPDSPFSRSCDWAYQSAASTCEPRSDETDLIAHWTGYGRRRSQFRRLVLPFRSEGRTWLLSAIQMDPAIDLLG